MILHRFGLRPTHGLLLRNEYLSDITSVGVRDHLFSPSPQQVGVNLN